MDLEAINQLKSEFERAAGLCGVQVKDLVRDTWKVDATPYPEKIMRQFGGFVEAKKIVLAARGESEENTEHPLHSSKVDHLSKFELSKYIASVIADCARDTSTPAHEINWFQFRRYISFRYGENNKGISRDAITHAGGYNVVRDSHFPPEPTDMVKNKLRLTQQANMNRKLGAHYAEQEYVIDHLIENFAKKIFKGRIEQVMPAPETTSVSDLILVVSDIHLGSDIKGSQTGDSDYGAIEEARRMASIVQQVSKHAAKRLHIFLIGDLIDGKIHQNDSAVISEQIARCIHVLSQMLAQLSCLFSEVIVDTCPGNHDRIVSKHPKRAVSEKFDAFSTIIAVALKHSCLWLRNIKINIHKTPYFVTSVGNLEVFATHGDTVITPGQSLRQMELAVAKMGRKFTKYDAYVMGHVHQAEVGYFSSGAMLCVNAGLPPVDDYAVSIGKIESHSGQMLLEVMNDERKNITPRLLKVGPEDDYDATLDKLIKPWEDY